LWAYAQLIQAVLFSSSAGADLTAKIPPAQPKLFNITLANYPALARAKPLDKMSLTKNPDESHRGFLLKKIYV
jgi:hypothetical protein